jgi:hypothetical protein
VAATAIVARGGAATVLSAELLAALGGATWPAVLAEHTWVLAVCWWRRRCGANTSTNSDDTRTSALPARGETAERVVGYLMAAVGLGALFFGLGGLLSTLLWMVLVLDVLELDHVRAPMRVESI